MGECGRREGKRRNSPIHGDATQMQDTGSGEVHVQTVPHVTHEAAEEPPVSVEGEGIVSQWSSVVDRGYSLARYLDAKVEGHGEHCHHNIRHGQRHHEVVGDDPVEEREGSEGG